MTLPAERAENVEEITEPPKVFILTFIPAISASPAVKEKDKNV